MIRSLLVTALILSFCGNVSADFLRRSSSTDFNYNQCDNSTGPFGWPSDNCDSVKYLAQSPINLCGFSTSSDSMSISPGSTFTTDATWTFLNDGRQFKLINPSSLSSISSGSISLNGLKSQTWNVGEIHIHVGRNDNEGSEHYIMGIQYGMEIQVMLYDSSYPSYDAAIASPSSTAVVGLSQLYDVNAPGTEPSVLSTIAGAAASATSSGAKMSTSIKIDDLFTGFQSKKTYSDLFFQYSGGLTTPKCSAVVQWVVMNTTIQVSSSTLNTLRSVLLPTTQEKLGKYGNFRPIQPRNGRLIFSSKALTSSPFFSSYYNFPCPSYGIYQANFNCDVVHWWHARNLEIISIILGGVLFFALLLICYLQSKLNELREQEEDYYYEEEKFGTEMDPAPMQQPGYGAQFVPEPMASYQ
eukprot:760651-Hanusia_phi.AAC.2